MPRPICVHCGNVYGQRDATAHQIRWPLNEERPPYQGNGVVIKDGHAYQTVSRNTYSRLMMKSPNPEILARQEAELAAMPEQSEMVATRWIWDGQSWSGGYPPFCTLRCALAYARKAYKDR
jgi:hypothetical protein